jgi:hypothetical protein
LGYTSETRRPVQREGVLALTGDRLCVLFVTLDKSEGFHDRVKYRDYAISPELFAWETQNQANPGNRLGQRFTESPGNGWRFFLFVRETPDFEFAALGEVHLERWERCEKGPIPIVWRLSTPPECGAVSELQCAQGRVSRLEGLGGAVSFIRSVAPLGLVWVAAWSPG